MSIPSKKVLNYLGTMDAQKDDLEDVYSSEDYWAFGVTRKPISSEPMIRFIKANGQEKSLAYSHLYEMDFDANVGIKLGFTEHVIELRGRGLHYGCQRISSHRVLFVAEADRPTAVLVADGEAVITEIVITHKRELLHG